MISLALARQLKEAGLAWQTAVNDFFAIPERGMDDKVFVISDMMVTMELVQGWPALTFHGTAEWAADHLLTHEANWLPTEEQLREQLIARLQAEGNPEIQLHFKAERFTCQVQYCGEMLRFEGGTAVDVYAHALLYLLPVT